VVNGDGVLLLTGTRSAGSGKVEWINRGGDDDVEYGSEMR